MGAVGRGVQTMGMAKASFDALLVSQRTEKFPILSCKATLTKSSVFSSNYEPAARSTRYPTFRRDTLGRARHASFRARHMVRR